MLGLEGLVGSDVVMTQVGILGHLQVVRTHCPALSPRQTIAPPGGQCVRGGGCVFRWCGQRGGTRDAHPACTWYSGITGMDCDTGMAGVCSTLDSGLFSDSIYGREFILYTVILFRGEITPLSSSYNISGLVLVCF